MSIQIILPDQSVKQFDHEPSTLEVAQSIGPRLAQATLAGLVNGEIVDLRMPLKSGTKLEIVTDKHAMANEVVRHSAAHIMAQAVQEMWPEIKVTIGPVIDAGFYYDFDSPRNFSPEDLQKIEKKMEEIVKRDIPITREEWSSEKAIEVFGKMGENFKVEIIQDLKTSVVSVYRQGEWFDLCRGPHVQKTGDVKAVKVLSLAGAYWRGDEKNKQLQRVYGTAFVSKKDLEHHMKLLEEAQKRDHRKLGKELGLFHFHQWAPGSPFFTPKGSLVYHELQRYLRELYVKYGYEEVITPQVFDVELYNTSGHTEHYKDNMYFTEIDERDFSMKPMNCPGHCLLYGMDHRSYRDLPWRVADFGRLHRYERSGVMHGLTRVRSFCQDDAHIFCSVEQLEKEIAGFMNLFDEVYKTLGMTNYKIFLSTRPESKLGSDEVWDKAEGALANALKSLKLPYQVNPGDGAFYGPKLDFLFSDAIERKWQLGTCQLDFQLPERFKLKFIGEDNSEHRPVMIHRAVLGSLERFIGVYIEHCAGRFPTWLAPQQVAIINVTEKQSPYGEELERDFKALGIRAHFDKRNEKLGYKIREAQLQKTPYMIVIGDKEVESKTVTVRLRNGQNFEAIKKEKVIQMIKEEIEQRLLDSPMNINQEATP
ncbi:MAG: threonine--tRNA ligase [Bdellovibrionales bacterium]